MYNISNYKTSSPSITIDTHCHGHTISLHKLWFFSPENFLFTLEKTFSDYDVVIYQKDNIFMVEIDKKHPLGNVLKHFYSCIYKYWLYY
jgi:hypothetical protein